MGNNYLSSRCREGKGLGHCGIFLVQSNSCHRLQVNLESMSGYSVQADGLTGVQDPEVTLRKGALEVRVQNKLGAVSTKTIKL